MGKAKVNGDAGFLDRRDRGMAVRTGTGEGGTEEKADGEISREDWHGPRM
jgi:hypothetical protein